MRSLLLTLFVLAVAAAALPARDGADERRPVRHAADPGQRDRLKQYLAAFRRLSPDAQERVRRLDHDLQDEDAATRVRLVGVMERYALWLSRLPETDRQRIRAAPAGPERLRVVRDVLEKQWLDNLPPGRKEQLAKATDVERPRLIDRWHREERERQLDRDRQLRVAEEMAILGAPERMRQFREDVQKFVKTDLEPKLNAKEKNRLTQAMAKPAAYAFYHQVWVLSEAHRLKPPGPPEFWERYRDSRKALKLPE